MLSPFTDLVDDDYVSSPLASDAAINDFNLEDLEQQYLFSSKLLKNLFRKCNISVNHPIRRKLWPRIINHRYGTSIPIPPDKESSSPPEDETPTPSPVRQSLLVGYELADRRLQTTYHLNARGRAIHLSLLHEISVSHPQTVYAPQTFPLLAALLHYLRPREALDCLMALLDTPGAEDMVVQRKSDWRGRCLALEQLAMEGFSKKALKKIKEEQKGDNKEGSVIEDKRNQLAVWACVLWHLPFECVVPIIDCYLVEGPKVLFRVGLVLWKAANKPTVAEGKSSSLTSSSEGQDLGALLQQIATSWPPTEAATLLKSAFKIRRLSRRHIARAIERAVVISQGMNSGLDLVDSLVVPCVLPGQRTYTAYGAVKAEFVAKAGGGRSSLRSVATTTKTTSTTESTTKKTADSALATPDEILSILENITDEALAQLSVPVVIFDSERDGVSLGTLFRRCEAHAKSTSHPQTILLVRTASGEGLVGAFCSQLWEPGSEWSFYGNGQSFLFRLRPGPAVFYKWANISNNEDHQGGDKFQRATASFIEVGGGLDSGPAGLRLDANLKMGESGSSPTFGSDCLITTEGDKVYAATVNEKAFCSFKISAVEVLGFVSA